MVLTRTSLEWQARADDTKGDIFNIQIIEMMKQSKEETTQSMETSTVQRVYSTNGLSSSGRCFCIEADGTTFWMICDSVEQKEEWIRAIKAVCCPHDG